MSRWETLWRTLRSSRAPAGTEREPADERSEDALALPPLATYLPRSRRSLVTLALTSLASLGLLLVLLSRLIAASQQVASAPQSPLIGRAAPHFTITSLAANGAPSEQVRLTALTGRPVVVNFWASWCDPCKEEAPVLEAGWERYRAQGVAFVGVDFKDTEQDATAFLHRYAITYPSGPDTAGDAAVLYGVTGIPETFFIDRQGKIVSKFSGAISPAFLDERIQALLQ